MFVYCSEEELKNQKREQWGSPRKNDNNRKSLPPSNRDKGRRFEREPRGWCVVGSCRPMKGLNHREDAAASGVPPSQKQGKKHPTLFSLPTTHLQPVIPVSQSQLTWGLGNSGCMRDQRILSSKERISPIVKKKIIKEKIYIILTRFMLQPLTTYQTGIWYPIWYCNAYRYLISKWPTLIELPFSFWRLEGQKKGSQGVLWTSLFWDICFFVYSAS